MKDKIDFVYFCIYNRFYKDGFGVQGYQSLKGPGFAARAMQALVFISYFWLAAFRLFLRFIFGKKMSGISFEMELLILLGLMVVFFFWFIEKRRYTDIYLRFRSTGKDTQQRVLNWTLFAAILPVIISTGFVLLILFW